VTRSLAELNQTTQDDFIAAVGHAFEHSAWIAAQAWHARPFTSIEQLHEVMTGIMWAAPDSDQWALIQAHPDLAGKAAIAGTLSRDSVREQSSAGLDRLSPEEHARFTRLNAAYRAQFGFPFIICVREHTKDSILAAFEERLAHTREQELHTALGEVTKIARLRLQAAVRDVRQGWLTTHVLDTAQGRPVAGLTVALWALEGHGERRLLKTVQTNAEGRTDMPLLSGNEVAIGVYELLFAVGAYFTAQGVALSRPPFLDEVPVRFAIADPSAHYHVPLLVTPWSYSTYRGS
jgi:2-oxo-4-hydroxy-4-carboxy-5-ureidoimidazoline decarboxylase